MRHSALVIVSLFLVLCLFLWLQMPAIASATFFLICAVILHRA